MCQHPNRFYWGCFDCERINTLYKIDEQEGGWRVKTGALPPRGEKDKDSD
jgi:hypothetical protein